MSDTGRKGVGEQISEGITPDSQKSTLDKASESVTDAGDKVAASVQPGMPFPPSAMRACGFNQPTTAAQPQTHYISHFTSYKPLY